MDGQSSVEVVAS